MMRTLAICAAICLAVSTSSAADDLVRIAQALTNGIHVAPDGTVYANSAAGEPAIYRDGRELARFEDLNHGGRTGGCAVTADSTYVYLAMTQRGDDGGDYPARNDRGQYRHPPTDQLWIAVRRYTLDGKPAPFDTGFGHDGSMFVVRSLPADSGTRITGLALDSAGRLYAAVPAEHRIVVIDAQRMGYRGDWKLGGPTRIAAAGDGSLWVLQTIPPFPPTASAATAPATGPALRQQVTHFVLGPRGPRQQGTPIVFPAADRPFPTDLAIDRRTGDLLIADMGWESQIVVYGHLDAEPQPAGRIEPLRLAAQTGGALGHAGPLSVGTDSAGNRYTAVRLWDQQTILLCLGPDGRARWQLPMAAPSRAHPASTTAANPP